MPLRIKEEDEDDITFLYRAIRINLNKVPFEYKDEAYTSMLFRGMRLIKEGQKRGFIYTSLSNKAIDWYRLSKRRYDLNEVYSNRFKQDEEFELIDYEEGNKNQNIVACLIRVRDCATDTQKRIIRDILKFIIKNPNKEWLVRDASVRMEISKTRIHRVVREIKLLFNALYKVRNGEDWKTVEELYEHIKFKR